MTIGEQLQQARHQRGWTQQAVAEHVHVTRQTISNWETGRSLPDIDSLLRLSTVYQLSLDQLLRSGDMMAAIHEQEAIQKRAQKAYRANLGIEAILLVMWSARHFGHVDQYTGAGLLLILLLVNLVTLRVARNRVWQLKGRRLTLRPRQSLAVALGIGLVIVVITAIQAPISFYTLGYGIGTGFMAGLLVWGLLPTQYQSV